MTRGRKTTLGAGGAALAVALVFSALYLAGFTRSLDLVAYDNFFRMRGARSGDERIAFVDIDDTAIRDLGRFPIPREKYAEIIELLSRPESRALAIGFDIFLVDPSPGAAVDREIGRAAREHGHVYFPAIFPQPFAAGSARLRAILEARGKLVGDAYFELERDPQFRDRFRADPGGVTRELAARLGVEKRRIDGLVLRMLDEKDLGKALLRIENTIDKTKKGWQREFTRGAFDAEFKGVSPARLRWMKETFRAGTNADILWKLFYLPALKKDPRASLLAACAARNVSYAQIASRPGLDRRLRARLAGRKGAAAGAFGPGALTSYAGRVPGEYPLLPLLEAGRELVSVQPFLSDPDGTVRSFPLAMVQGERAYPAMGLALALEGLGARFADCRLEGDRFVVPGAAGRPGRSLPVDAVGRVLVDWNGRWGESFRHVSLGRLLPPPSQGQAARKQAERLAASLKDKLVFVGLTATGTHDLNPTPFQPRYPMVGINAHVADGMLRGRFLRECGAGPVLALVALVALAGALLGGAMGRTLGPLIAAAGGAGLFLGSFASFAWGGLFVPPVPALGAFALAYVGGLFWRYMVTEREGRKVRQIFAARTSPELVEEMMRNPEAVRLGGKRVQATIFFADLAGFTSVAESIEPEDLIHLLNAYLSEISAAIIEDGGYLDKYEGDAVMAILGVPVERPDHAAAACRAALAAQKRLDALRARLEAEGQPLLRCRIGLASGVVVAGNIGSQARSDYTALGDTVNLASRLEGANKIYGTRVLVSEETAGSAGSGFVFREIDLLRVRGRRKASRALELFGLEGEVAPEAREGLELYAQALALYRGRRFEEALKLFMEAGERLGGADGPSETFAGRCQRFALRPPPEDWDGVYEMTGK